MKLIHDDSTGPSVPLKGKHGKGTGKWRLPDVPKRNWECIDEFDLKQRMQICQMCESAEIRFVHVLKHPEYPDALEVGRQCASYMEADSEAALCRERRMKSIATRRLAWARRKWRLSASSNPRTTVSGGFIVVLCHDYRGWHVCVIDKKLDETRHFRRYYKQQDECRIAAFDDLITIEKERQDYFSAHPWLLE